MQTTQLVRKFEYDAGLIWCVIGSFKAYERGYGVEQSSIEDNRPDNEVGSIRRFRYYGAPARQRLTAFSAPECTYSWESLDPYDDLRHYELRLKVETLPDNGATVTWGASFDAPATRSEFWSAFFREQFGKSFDKLQGILDLSLSA